MRISSSLSPHRSHLCNTEDLGRGNGEVERVGNKLVVPGLMGAGEVVRRAITSSVYILSHSQRQQNLPVTISRVLKANLNLLGSKTLAIMHPLRQPSRNTIVDTLKQLAVLVRRGNHKALVVTLLVAVAVRLDARGTFGYARHGDVEVVVAALAGAAGLPVLDLPGPAFWDGDLAGDGAGHGG